jgi:hypothetical protein
MDDLVREADAQGAVEIRVYRDDRLIHSEMCESFAEASDVVDVWLELGTGIEFEVDDLSARHRQGDIDEPTLDEKTEEDYPDVRED